MLIHGMTTTATLKIELLGMIMSDDQMSDEWVTQTKTSL